MKPDHAAFHSTGDAHESSLIIAGFIVRTRYGTAFAHGNKVHVRGTVEKISADSVVVKTADGSPWK